MVNIRMLFKTDLVEIAEIVIQKRLDELQSIFNYTIQQKQPRQVTAIWA